ncbi:MAG: hypothetical protein NUV91_06780, partial [Candidatus Omnitrophica bacterium]|nr:hypothetical protein [Candidatus Omnitrophota bacterium]
RQDTWSLSGAVGRMIIVHNRSPQQPAAPKEPFAIASLLPPGILEGRHYFPDRDPEPWRVAVLTGQEIKALARGSGRGNMGRWEDETKEDIAVTLSETTEVGELTVHHVVRISNKEGVVEEEFLIGGENSPRDIVLSTGSLTSSEQAKLTQARGILKNTDESVEIRKIVRDENDSAGRNRIYGLAIEVPKEGQSPRKIIFIREDILERGSIEQIAEAFDHEYRELSDVPHDQIRQQQYSGGLRELITTLSTEDKKKHVSTSTAPADASPAVASIQQQQVGGINLDPGLIRLQKIGKDLEWKLSPDPAVWEKVNVPGFVPIIIDIIPISDIPMFIKSK